MESNEQLAKMHSEHADWQKKILYYREELNSLNSSLESYVQKVPPRDISPSIEHFQNQFIRQSEVLDIMRHDFKQYENRIEDAQNGQSTTIDKLDIERKSFLEQLNNFDKIFTDLKAEFSEFQKGELQQL
jgi:uncharacterized coiled-coil DUF342 family protein